MLQYLARIVARFSFGSRSRDDNRGATINEHIGNSNVNVNSPSSQSEWGATDWSKILANHPPCTACDNGRLLALPYFPQATEGRFEIVYKCSNAHCDFSISLLPGQIRHGDKTI